MSHKCPICQSESDVIFGLNIFGSQRDLLECESCGTCFYYNIDWLDLAYASAIVALDTGAVSRCIYNSYIVNSIIGIGSRRNKIHLDYGGGAGLLTRLLRDVGVNSYWYDKHCQNIYAKGFDSFKGQVYIVSMIEVIEHLPNPQQVLSQICGEWNPDYLYITTEFVPERIDPSWWYLVPETGQHVTFLTKEAMQRLANSKGYMAYFYKGFILWSKSPLNFWSKFGIWFRSNKLIRILIYIITKIKFRDSIQNDFRFLKK